MPSVLRKPLCVPALFVLLAASASARAAAFTLTLESAPDMPMEGVKRMFQVLLGMFLVFLICLNAL